MKSYIPVTPIRTPKLPIVTPSIVTPPKSNNKILMIGIVSIACCCLLVFLLVVGGIIVLGNDDDTNTTTSSNTNTTAQATSSNATSSNTDTGTSGKCIPLDTDCKNPDKTYSRYHDGVLKKFKLGTRENTNEFCQSITPCPIDSNWLPWEDDKCVFDKETDECPDPSTPGMNNSIERQGYIQQARKCDNKRAHGGVDNCTGPTTQILETKCTCNDISELCSGARLCGKNAYFGPIDPTGLSCDQDCTVLHKQHCWQPSGDNWTVDCEQLHANDPNTDANGYTKVPCNFKIDDGYHVEGLCQLKDWCREKYGDKKLADVHEKCLKNAFYTKTTGSNPGAQPAKLCTNKEWYNNNIATLNDDFKDYTLSQFQDYVQNISRDKCQPGIGVWEYGSFPI